MLRIEVTGELHMCQVRHGRDSHARGSYITDFYEVGESAGTLRESIRGSWKTSTGLSWATILQLATDHEVQIHPCAVLPDLGTAAWWKQLTFIGVVRESVRLNKIQEQAATQLLGDL